MGLDSLRLKEVLTSKTMMAYFLAIIMVALINISVVPVLLFLGFMCCYIFSKWISPNITDKSIEKLLYLLKTFQALQLMIYKPSVTNFVILIGIESAILLTELYLAKKLTFFGYVCGILVFIMFVGIFSFLVYSLIEAQFITTDLMKLFINLCIIPVYFALKGFEFNKDEDPIFIFKKLVKVKPTGVSWMDKIQDEYFKKDPALKRGLSAMTETIENKIRGIFKC